MSYTEAEVEDLLHQQKESTRLLLRRDYQLSKANEELKTLDREKSEFVSIAAHQLRTPLSAIKWAQQIMLDGDTGPVTEAQRDLLKQAQDSIDRMVHLVHDLLSVDHLEYNQAVFKFKRTNIDLLLKEIVNEHIPAADQKKLTLEYLPEFTGAEILCDTEKLKEVFANLINNSIKYTLSGGVTIVTKKRDEFVDILVTDTGIGIPKKGSVRLFNKFVRFDNARRIDADGSGLGLFIVKKIVAAHNGTVTYDSVEGKGSTFTVSLPLCNE